MPQPDTRWRVRPPITPGGDWAAEEFVPGGESVSRISFKENGRAQATRMVAQQNQHKDLRTKVGGNVLRDLLKSEAHQNARKNDGNQ